MKDQLTFKYRMAELTNVCPFPIDSFEFFTIQIKSNDGRKTKNLNITPEEFRKLEKLLLGIDQ